MGATFPRALFDAASVEGRHRFSALREFFAGVADVQSLAHDREAIHDRVEAWSLGGLVFGRNTHGASVTTLPGNTSYDDRLVLRMNLQGTTKAIVGGEPVLMKPGAIYLRDQTRSFYGVTPTWNCSPCTCRATLSATITGVGAGL